jgi:hypothetical protein
LRSKLTALASAYFAATLLAASVGTANCQQEKPPSEPQPLAETEASGDSPTARQEGSAQETKKRGRWHSWMRMAAEAQARQPDWLSPLATTSGRLKQEVRLDVFDQPSPNETTTYQFGGGKGLEFITSSRTQLLIGVPSFTLLSPNGPAGGFGDLPLMLKFRIASADRGEGDFLLTVILGATAPTGSHRYGAGDAVLSPTLAFGKGWRRFDVQSTFGANLPAGDTARLGRQLVWNTAFQYEAAWKLWPELEVNSTLYRTGPHAGDKQVFLTPGFGFGRVHLSARFRFSSAAGIEIAATRFHSYNHRWIFSERLSF